MFYYSYENYTLESSYSTVLRFSSRNMGRRKNFGKNSRFRILWQTRDSTSSIFI